MGKINIEKAFITDNKSVFNFMNQAGQGLYIPLYQRPYSWDTTNIEQLLEDISKGISCIVLDRDEQGIRFLGTIITLIEANRENIYPREPQAVPSRIEKLIDGQQRLSTIAVLSTLLLKQLKEIQKKSKRNIAIYPQIEEICNMWTQKLLNIFSVDLLRGVPTRKPKIIRGNKDCWTFEKPVDEVYKSDVASYIGSFIEAHINNKDYPKISKEKHGIILSQNIREMESWLRKSVIKAHDTQHNEFTPAWEILNVFSQDDIWDYARPELVELINNRDFSSNKTDSYILCELVQLLTVCHYLLDRCCFTVIQPTDEDWAFDMFQSLNATGTPLTAIETFRPSVVNETDKYEIFKDSENEKSFKKIEDLFEDTRTAQKKSQRTNEFLTSFFIAYNGSIVSSHFSHQRKNLITSFNDRINFNDKSSFISFFGNYAEFYKKIWIDLTIENQYSLGAINSSNEANLAMMLIHFLKTASHKMAITVLGSFYSDVIDGKDSSIISFINAVKTVSAFYFLWRTTSSNSGLDSEYRDFFKSDNKKWTYEDGISINNLKNHFKQALSQKGIKDKESWIEKARTRLNYNDAGIHVCKLALLICAHDTIPDDSAPGLIKIARQNTYSCLTFEKWVSPYLKTIEHIAPQTKNWTDDNDWDPSLYSNDTIVQKIGNLTLLPQDLNSSAGNKSWKEKYLYYKCIGEVDETKLQEIDNHARSLGVILNPNTINLLKKSDYSNHVKSLLTLSEHTIWNDDIVNKRTLRMLDIIWDRISPWLYVE